MAYLLGHASDGAKARRPPGHRAAGDRRIPRVGEAPADAGDDALDAAWIRLCGPDALRQPHACARLHGTGARADRRILPAAHHEFFRAGAASAGFHARPSDTAIRACAGAADACGSARSPRSRCGPHPAATSRAAARLTRCAASWVRENSVRQFGQSKEVVDHRWRSRGSHHRARVDAERAG